VIIFIVVDFPAPLGPNSPIISPFFNAKDTSLTATLLPYFLVNPDADNVKELSVSTMFF
jgi:hypothetical protein